jgi:hypothetical protein
MMSEILSGLTIILSTLVLAIWCGCIWVDVIKGGKK